MMKKTCLLAMLVVLVSLVSLLPEKKAAARTAASGSCYCRNQGIYYDLFYIDHDGNPQFIYSYLSSAECEQGLRNTALCYN